MLFLKNKIVYTSAKNLENSRFFGNDIILIKNKNGSKSILTSQFLRKGGENMGKRTKYAREYYSRKRKAQGLPYKRREQRNETEEEKAERIKEQRRQYQRNFYAKHNEKIRAKRLQRYYDYEKEHGETEAQKEKHRLKNIERYKQKRLAQGLTYTPQGEKGTYKKRTEEEKKAMQKEYQHNWYLKNKERLQKIKHEKYLQKKLKKQSVQNVENPVEN